MIKTGCIFDTHSSDEGLLLFVARFAPKRIGLPEGVKWDVRLAPSIQLLKDWKDELIDWEDYTARFVFEMTQNPESLTAMANLSVWADNHDVVLLCYELESNPFCHRHLLKTMIGK